MSAFSAPIKLMSSRFCYISHAKPRIIDLRAKVFDYMFRRFDMQSIEGSTDRRTIACGQTKLPDSYMYCALKQRRAVKMLHLCKRWFCQFC